MRRERKGLHLHRGLLVAAVFAVMLICQAALAAAYPYTTTTNAKVNMRRSASSSSVVLERIPNGAAVQVTGASGNYYQVVYNNRTGYVVKQYLNEAPGATVTIAPVQETTATGYPYTTTTNDQVNLRKEQSTSSRRLASIPEGAAVTVSSVSGSYAEVTYNGISGWCLKKYVNLKTIVKPTAAPTAGPTLAPAENEASYTTLQLGSTGSRVQALQEALIELGFLTGSADGVFGAGTQEAVIALQTKNDYPATGVVDANLQAHIYSGTPKNAKGVKTDVKTLPPISGVNIYLNDRGQLVRDVQTRLKDLGYYNGDITGVYDTKTRTAVTSFQKTTGLQADGICGVKTQAALLGTDVVPEQPGTTAPAVMATPAPTFQIPTGTVRRGDTGESVRLIQQRLIDLGYLSGKVDGVFGAASQKALEAFQIKNNLKVDGAAGTATYAVLFSYDALAAGAMPTPAVTAVPTAAPATATPSPAPITKENVVVVREGSVGAAVTRLQERLTQLGYYTATVDGTCKADDVAAIRVFQRYNGLTVDGVAGYDTQVKLYSLTAVTFSGDIAGGTVDTFTTLRKGMTGDLITQLQQRLISLGYLAAGSADGNYGTKTAEAVYAFQKANGLVRDGVAGSKTLNKLYGSAAATATPAPTSTPNVTDSTVQIATNATLRKGDVNSSVKAMQQRLIELGYLSGKVDGNFGAQTFAALQAFQRANALSVDGIAGSKTLAALNSVNAKGTGTSAAAPTSAPTMVPAPSVNNTRVSAANVQYQNWYTVIKAKARTYPYATVYDFETGLSWQVHMFSLGAHADSEPLTASDTAKMLQAFGGNTWNPKAVWVIFGNGEMFMASTHSYPHDVQHIKDNNFAGHLCIHFPRTQAQVTAIGTYATSHQKEIDDGWARTQDMR